MASATTAALVLNANSAISGGVTLGDSTTGRTGGVTVNGLHAIATGSTIAVSLPVNVSFTGRTLLPQAVQFHTPFAGAQNATLSYSGLIELAGDTTLNATAAFNSNNVVNFNGRLSDGAGSHRLIKQGIGAVRLSAPNAYDGGTEIEGGTLIAANPGAYGSGPVNVLDGAQAFLLTGGTYANPFSITGLGQTVNGLNNTSPDGAIQINTSGVNLSGPITLTGNARIAGFFSSNSIISSNIGEDENGPWLLELGSPGAANGNGTFTLTGENTYGGGTAIHRITLRARGNKVFGSGPVTLTGGGSTTLQTRLEVGDVTLPNDILLDTTGRTNSTAATQTWGAITGFPGDNTTPSTAVIDGDVEIFSSVANGGHFAAQGHPTDSILRINGEVVSNVVPVTVAAGVVEFGGGGSYADLHHYQGTLKLAAANGLSTGAILTQGHQGASVFDLNGRNQSLVALARAGSGAASVTNNGGTAATLTLAPGSGATHAYSGSFVTGASPLNLSVGGSNGSVVSLGGDSSQFAGTTTVTSGGTLEITGNHGGAGSTLVVQSGATLAGTGTIGGNLTLNSGARLRVNPTAGTLNIAGNLTVIGTATIEFTGTPGASNVIYTVNGTNNSTSGQYAILNPGNYNSPQFNIAGNQLVLTTGVLNLTWTGTGGTTWNINGTSNWTNGTAAFKFLNGYAVNFTDSPASDPLIGVAATVQPSSITFANSARSYAFTNTGAGRIQTTTLVKNGSGRAGFEVPLEVSGTIALNGGTLLLSSPEAGATEPDIAAAVTGAGTLEIAAGYLNPLTLAGDNSGFSGPLVISREEVKIAATAATGAGPLVFGSEGTTGIDVPQLTLLAGVAIQNPVTMGSFADTARISGAGSLAGGASVTVAGTGLLELGTVNSYSGDTTIVEGTLWGTVIGSIPATSTVVFGSAASGAVDTVLQLPPAASADQTVLSSPLSLSAAAPGSSAIVRRVSGQLARITGEVSLNGRPIIAGSGGIHFAGRISGDGDLVVENGGGEAVRISHPANDFTGDVRVNNGAFRNAAAETIPDAADVIIGDFGTFEVGADETVERLQGTANSLVRPASGTVDLTLGSGGSSFDFGGSFGDNGTSVIHLNKAGTGTLTLSGASTSTGRLRVLQGRVDVTGSIASRIEVGAAGILGGTGIIQFPGQGAGLAPVFGRIAPGTAATVGTLDLRNALSFQTGAGIDIGIADWSGTTPGTTHGLLLSPQIVFGGGSFTLRVDATGMTGFTEAPRTFVIATANQQVFPPGINVQQVVTTGFPGTGTWTVTSSGNNLLLNYQPSSGYASWIGGYPTLGGNAALPGSDPDQDGLANVLEYVLGGNPTLSSAAVAPTGAVQGDDFVVRYFRSDASESDTQQTVWWSPDLLTWTPVGIPASSAGAVTVQENGAAADEITVTIPRNGGDRIFTRLEANPNP
jgi:autotransporter-associated beta strand protein